MGPAVSLKQSARTGTQRDSFGPRPCRGRDSFGLCGAASHPPNGQSLRCLVGGTCADRLSLRVVACTDEPHGAMERQRYLRYSKGLKHELRIHVYEKATLAPAGMGGTPRLRHDCNSGRTWSAQT